jgi:DNA primase
MTAADSLARFWAKRDFSVTSEPRSQRKAIGKSLSFVIQKHAASRLHHDWIETAKAPFAAGASKPGRWSRRVAGSERWIVPRTVEVVEFGEWAPDGQIRRASYVGVRTDRLSKTIVRETAKQLSGPVRTAGKAAVGGIKVTHAERIIDPSSGLTKLDLVRYYESVADWILPHLQGRPCSLVRGPSGVIGQLFFQKHGDKEKLGIPGIRELDPALWAGHDALLEVGSAHALAGAAQMNVIEFHTWNSLAKNIDKLERMILDLDPGEGTVWQPVQEAAMLVRTLLSELRLESWLKTSGGKGAAYRRSDCASARPRRCQGLLPGGCPTPGSHHPLEVCRKERALESCRQALCRLPAQQSPGYHGCGVLGARAARAWRVDAGELG